ncbi:hypothetical protein K456DRAFT_1587680 [Colletotrichum gloeosporioides 23]|nr:hypothetical protein K456DRAFT_1587680 [Colletotrichum gloeosporioides 23]
MREVCTFFLWLRGLGLHLELELSEQGEGKLRDTLGSAWGSGCFWLGRARRNNDRSKPKPQNTSRFPGQDNNSARALGCFMAGNDGHQTVGACREQSSLSRNVGWHLEKIAYNEAEEKKNTT